MVIKEYPTKKTSKTLSKKQINDIVKKLHESKIELNVRNIYEEGLSEYFNVDIKYPYSCDGYLECMLENEEGNSTKLMLITEYKYDKNFMNNLDKAKVLVQVLFYLKRFEINGDDLPNVILVGDKDEVFVMHSNALKPYLDWDIEWSIAPSNAAEKNMKLVLDIRDNEAINPFVHTIDDNFNFSNVCEEIRRLTFDIKSDIRITDNNMSKAFDYFCNNVLKDKKKLQANEIVHIFMDLMLNPRDVYMHPKKKNILVLSDSTEVPVHRGVFDSFFNHYTRENYSITEKQKLTEVADRLIEDTERRRKGEFYTPTIWVNEAHKMITEQFGENWRNEYVVWDCAWGTGNLTRDFKFNELYCSTLNEGDLEIGKKYNVSGTKYNTHGNKFQYDFLNDDVEFFEQLKVVKKMKGYLEETDFVGSKLYSVAPRLISSLLAGKKLMFLINPPYGTGSTYNSEGNKKDIANTKLAKVWKNEFSCRCTEQLYAQFIYRILKLKDILSSEMSLALFAPTAYMSGESFFNLTTVLNYTLPFKSGFLLQASTFADVKDNWGISFCIWCSQSKRSSDVTILNVKTIKEDGIFNNYTKTIYFCNKNDKCSSWVRCEGVLTTMDFPQMTSAINVYPKPYCGRMIENSIGYLFNNMNIVNTNNQGVSLFTSPYKMGHGTSIIDSNFNKVLSNFTARRLITGQYANWVNWQDEYMIPNIGHELYHRWETDCIVYSLFNSKSNQSSLRQIDYNNKKWDIKNEFFFMSVQDMLNLADVNGNEYVYEDIRENGEERYVYKLLQEVELSEDAQAVLDKAIELTKESFKYRDMFNDDHPEYHINTWDAGWYQIKGLLKEYMPEELKEFNEMYKALGDRMRPLVYELGFLKE